MIINFKCFVFFRKQISKVSVNISSIAHNNQQLKQKNEELKEILGEMSVRKQFNNRARVVVNEKDMMIERMRYNIKVLQKKIRQENLELSDCDMDADDEAEYDENSKQFTFNELSALSLPITYYANYHANNNNIADDTDDDIANNGRDVDDDIEIVEPVSQPMPSTTTGIRYHMFEYQTRYCENNVRS